MLTINYIAEIILPSKSAQSIQVMKMCDAFSKKKNKTNLHVFNKDKTRIYKNYNCSKKVKIITYNINLNSFINRLIFAFNILIKSLKKKNSELYYSRSIVSAILLSQFKTNVILEIHHELKNFTYLIFWITYKLNFLKNLKFVFFSKNLKKTFNLKNKSIVLDDAVDLHSFKVIKKNKVFNKTCVYTGSFSKGKGIEIIIKLSKIMPNINFHLYGDLTNSKYTKDHFAKQKNLKYLGFVEYKDMPKILNQYDLYLMPYSKKVYVRSNNLEVGKFMSPMKLFEYMAGKGVLMASKMPVYNHILNKKNSILINQLSINLWKNNINNFFLNKKKYKHLSLNSNKIIKEFTWDNRVKKILKFINV